MAGNVWEWCSDWYKSDYYASSPAANPAGPSSGDFRVVRGGCWAGDWGNKRAAIRGTNDQSYSSPSLGFRCVREADITSAVEDEELIRNIIDLPKLFEMKQNYPNPFNPNTIIELSIPKYQHVSLFIYNILGRHIRTLHSGPLRAGIHEISWDGRSDNGAKVSSGIYFYQLNAGNFIETKKMILMY